MQFTPELVGLTDENSFLINKIFLSREQVVKRKLPKWKKVGNTYEFLGWAPFPHVSTTKNTLLEFGTGNASLRQLPTRDNAEVYEKDGFTYIKLTQPVEPSEFENGLDLAHANMRYWPILENYTTYKLRDAEVGEISSIMPWLVQTEAGVIQNQTFINEEDWLNNSPNGQNALQMKPMAFSWWVDLMQGGDPGFWHNQGVVFPIVDKLRISPANFGDALGWTLGSFPNFDSSKGAVLRLRLVNQSGIYDNANISGEPKSSMYECYLNIHTGECRLG